MNPEAQKVIDQVHLWQIERLKVERAETTKPHLLHFWVCRKCGSSGGRSPHPEEQLEVSAPTGMLFLAGTPLIDLSKNCEEAKKTIDTYVEKYPDWREHMEKSRGIDFPFDPPPAGHPK